MKKDIYENPLITRYAGNEISQNWSPQKKFSTWRRMWLALATAEKELGLPISDKQLEEMSAHLDDIDFEYAAKKEKEFRHDVMSHIHTFAKSCPSAAPIIHLGATSCFVGDNTDLIQIKDAMNIIKVKLIKLIASLRTFSMEYKNLPTLGFTHYQPAQLTTVGKRASLWLQDFLIDFERLEDELENLPFRGVKGTTGTQASFLELFKGDHEKVKKLNIRVAEIMGFKKTIPVSGQTYTRKMDFYIVSLLSGIAQSAHKMSTDIRLLANLKEIEEPFGKKQIGSSAMAYKRNPMRSERICSLARYVMSLLENTAMTHSTQWFERTLDDSANRRIVLPEAFLAVDAILSIANNVCSGLNVWPLIIKKRIEAELPFMATENILMECVKSGGDRQELHEAIRIHSMEASRNIKEKGNPNDLIERIKNDDKFAVVKDILDKLLDPQAYVGRSSEQVEEFVFSNVDPVLKQYKTIFNEKDEELKV
ncbi:MAG: adenylosuccinate lyase [Verrucomicrobiota bacterium]|nr:adenylosuccinate lyase [Verrucomicrobiota bacterium]